MMRILWGCLLAFVLNDVFAAKNIIERGNPKAPKQGTFIMNLQSFPTTLNPVTSTDTYASTVQGYVLDTLLTLDSETYEWTNWLAEDWSVSDDSLSFEFTIRDGVKWHDGKPLTIEDVKFSYDLIWDDRYQTAHKRPYYENIKEAKIIGKRKIRFTAKTKYFYNLTILGLMKIVPKHLYENPTEKKKKKLNKTLVGTGPYILDKFDRGKKLVLKRNKDWWGNKIPALKGSYNYNKVIMKAVKDESIAIEMLKKGQLHYQQINTESAMKRTSGKGWGTDYFKVKYENLAPKGYSFIGWNLKKDLFKSRKVRRALAMLINRKEMNDKFNNGLYEYTAGPMQGNSIYASKKIKPIEFDPKAALALLREDGWKDSDGDKILDKVINGKKVKLSFTILDPLKDFEKYLTIFKQDAKLAGVEVNIKIVEWNSFIKLIDERNFDAVRLAWGGSVDWDPKQIWHSNSIANGGSNFIGFDNSTVDKLIDEARGIMDKKERSKILQRVYEIIAQEQPYAFLFNSKFNWYIHDKKLKRLKDTYKYAVGWDQYWWLETK